MYLEIYIDVIFFINFFMDILLLFIVKKIVKYQSSKLRMCLGAFIGAIGSCILAVVPYLNQLMQFLLSYVLICFLMIQVTFHQVDRRGKLKGILLLYITTFFLGGVINSLYYNTKLGYYFNELIQGRLFKNRDTTFFVLAVIVGMVALYVFTLILRNLRNGDLDLYQTELMFEGKGNQIIGLLDTGNSLYDPIYKKPVIIVEYSAIEPLMTEQQANQLRIMLNTVEGTKMLDKDEVTANDSYEVDPFTIMMIPYHSIGKKNGMLPAIVMNRIIICSGNEKTCCDKVITAVTREKLSKTNVYQVILHKDIM